jgi:hypothetical protein
MLARRVFLAGAAGVGLLAGIGGSLALPSAAMATTPTALDAAIAEARSMVGWTLEPTVDAAVTVSPWANTAPAGEWCAWWATYIARATGVGRHTSSSELYNFLPHFAYGAGTPQPGDFIYYVNSYTTGHTGFVVDVVGGVAHTVEGNSHGAPTKVWAYSQPWGGVLGFSRPNWANAAPPAPTVLKEPEMWILKQTDGTYASTYWAVNPNATYDASASPYFGRAIQISQPQAASFDDTTGAKVNVTGANFTYIMQAINLFH